MLRIGVIVGSTRQGRFSERPAQWISEVLGQREGVTAEVLDLRDFPLPFFEEEGSPAMAAETYTNPVVQQWRAAVGRMDGFVIVTPEYNHSMPGVLKNALDYVFTEWNDKPVTFVSYGGAGGARSIGQLRQIVIELQMIPLRNSVHIYGNKFFPILMGQEPWDPKEDASLMKSADAMLTQLLWWAQIIKEAKEK